jgi:hypothetical protein
MDGTRVRGDLVTPWSRSEAQVRRIIDEWWQRNPEAYRRFCNELRARGTTLLAYVRWRRDRLRAERELDAALNAYLEMEVST